MILTAIKYLWAGPNTLAALHWALGCTLVSTGLKPTRNQVRWRIVEGVIEIHGGVLTDMLRVLPTSGSLRKPAGAAALTLGHVVFAVDQPTLDRTREHERVHVRQYERWGPLFLPLYLLFSGCAKCRGDHAYFGNRFEREAYAVSHPERLETSNHA